MSPRAFQTILVAPTMGNKDRLELESKVLAAALKQSFERGDTIGVSLAHRQIFLLLKAQQSTEGDSEHKDAKKGKAEPVRSGEPPPQAAEPAPAAPSGGGRKRSKKRTMPNIVWTEDEDPPGSEAAKAKATEAQPGETVAEVTESIDAPDAAAIDASPDAETAADMADTGGGEDEHAETPAADGAAEGASEGELEDVERPTFNAYGILAVDQSATFEDIHRSFLYLVRKVLFALKKAKRKQRKPLLEHLQDLWIAHDILSDPVTRTDFDFRLLGLRGSPDVLMTTAPDYKDEAAANSTRTPMRIGELMQCAGLLEQQELEIAADMHKAMPEMLFGAFLVKQGFISEEDLGQVLIGQWLLKNGDMSVNHYQGLMKRWREDHVPIEDSAVADGVISANEMERLVYSFNQDTQSQIPTLGLRKAEINAEEAAKRNLSIGHAVPQWKDQLDWSAPPEPVQQKFEERNDERKPMDPGIEIEGITDGAPKDGGSGKKSLRRLMEGIHSPDTAGKDEGSGRTLKSILSAAAEEPEKMRADPPLADTLIDVEPHGAPPQHNALSDALNTGGHAEIASDAATTGPHAEYSPGATTGSQPTFSTTGSQPAFSDTGAQPTFFSTTGSQPTFSDTGSQPTFSTTGSQPTFSTTGSQPAYTTGSHAEYTESHPGAETGANPEIGDAPQAIPGSEYGPPPQTNSFTTVPRPSTPRQAKLTWDPDAMDETEETAEVAQVDMSEVAQQIMSEAGVPESKMHTQYSSETRELPREFVSGRSDSSATQNRSFEPEDEDPADVFGDVNFDDEDEVARDIDYFAYSNEDSAYSRSDEPKKNETKKVEPPPAPRPQQAAPSQQDSPSLDLVYFEEKSKQQVEPVSAPPAVAQDAAPDTVQSAQNDSGEAGESKEESPVTPIDLVYFEDEEKERKLREKRAQAQTDPPTPLKEAESQSPEPPKAEPPKPEPPKAEPPKPPSSKSKESSKQTQEISKSSRSETVDIVRPFPSNELDTAGDDMDLSMFKPKIRPVPPPISAEQRGMDSSGEFASFRPRSDKDKQTPDAEASAAETVSEPAPAVAPGAAEDPQSDKITSEVEVHAQQIDEEVTNFEEDLKNLDAAVGEVEAAAPQVEDTAKDDEALDLDAGIVAVEDDAQRIDAEVDNFEEDLRNLDAAVGDVEGEIDLAGLGIDVEASRDAVKGEDEKEETVEEVAAKETPKTVQKREGLKKNDREQEQQRLKSGEWQLVYKLEGSIAEMFLSDEAEEDMTKKMRPRLTEIDSVIPSSITKLVKDDTKSGGTNPSESADKEKKNDDDSENKE